MTYLKYLQTEKRVFQQYLFQLDHILVFQAGEFGEHLGDIKLNVENDKVDLVSYKLYTIDSSIKQDKTISKELEPFEKEMIAAKTDIIAKTATNIIADRIGGLDEIIYGDGFESNDDFTEYTITNIHGVVKVKSEEL